MSLAEIKSAVRGLTAEELLEVEQLVVELRRRAGDPAPREVRSTDGDVAPAMDAVFAKHGELLRRLAE